MMMTMMKKAVLVLLSLALLLPLATCKGSGDGDDEEDLNSAPGERYIGSNGNWFKNGKDTGESAIVPPFSQHSSLTPAGNPIITSIYTADPSAHVWSTDPDRLYLYPSQDIMPPQGCNLMDRYHVFSTDNMVDWIDHGEILKRDDLPVNPWGAHHSDAYFMWAPDAAYNPAKPGGKGPYFFYFPHSTGADVEGPTGWGSNWKIGVAHSSSPYKDFKNNEVVMLKDKNGDPINGDGKLIDPCIFQDGNDYYFATGGSQEFRIAKLAPDMVTLAEDFHVYTQTQLPDYHEGPWMFTRKNDAGTKIYYLVYPGLSTTVNGKTSDQMLYATNTIGPYGPWTYKGPFLGPVNTGDTSHGSVVQFKGQWYIFYHDATKSSGSGLLRSVCVDELFFNPDGTIKQVIQTDKDGGVRPRGPVASESVLNTKFGTGNWTIETKFRDAGKINWDDFEGEDDGNGGRTGGTLYEVPATLEANQAAGWSVLPGGSSGPNYNNLQGADYGARIRYDTTLRQTQDLHVPGSYVEFRYISGGTGTTGKRAILHANYTTQSGGSVLITVNGKDKFELPCPATLDWEGPPTAFASTIITLESDSNIGPTTDYDETTRNLKNVIRVNGSSVNFHSIRIFLAK